MEGDAVTTSVLDFSMSLDGVFLIVHLS